MLRGRVVELGNATVSLDGARVLWSRDEALSVGVATAFPPHAGSGVAAQIVDLLMSRGPHGPAPVRPDNAAAGAHRFAERERAIPVDQTHVSVIVDDRWVVKLVSRWRGADRASDILRRLDASGSEATARLGGILEWDHPECGVATLAIVTEYVPDSADGWDWAVGDLVDALSERSGEGPASEPNWPEWPGQLGTLAAQMHTALIVDRPSVPGTGEHGAIGSPESARGDFEVSADPSADPRVHRRAEAHARLDEVWNSLNERDPADRRLGSRRHAFTAAIDSMPDQYSSPLVTPHGDFHVGQVLRTSTGRFVIVDFDGDPQWNIERQMRSDGADRDVAHMLASLDLVAAVAQRRLGGVDERAWQWAAAAQQQFLAAYLATVPAGFLDVRALDGLVAEQMLAEVSYSRDFLPRWRYACDGVISHRYAPDPNLTLMEDLWTPPDL